MERLLIFNWNDYSKILFSDFVAFVTSTIFFPQKLKFYKFISLPHYYFKEPNYSEIKIFLHGKFELPGYLLSANSTLVVKLLFTLNDCHEN